MEIVEQAAFPADLMGETCDGAHGEVSSEAKKGGNRPKRILRAEKDRTVVVAAVRDQRISRDLGLRLLISSGLTQCQALKLL